MKSKDYLKILSNIGSNRMKFKIVEEFLFYKKMYNGQNYSFEKNPSKWKFWWEK